MDGQERDVRYKFQHAGDIFIEMIEEMGRVIKRSFRGVSLTHDIHSLERNRKAVIYRIGERIVEIRKERSDLLADDELLSKIFSEYDVVQTDLDDLIKEREERLERIRGKISTAQASGPEIPETMEPASAPA